MGENKNGYVLAMYDIRGKQEFIFRTGRIKEIVGGSAIIRDLFDDYLYKEAKGIAPTKGSYIGTPTDGEFSKGIFHDNADDFTKTSFEKHLKEGYIGEVVYDGGGNFLLLFQDETTFQECTKRFTRRVKEEIGSLRVLGVCESVSDALDDYLGDRDRLYKKHAKMEAYESNIGLWPSLPIVQVDRRTSQPLVRFWDTSFGICPKGADKLSLESYAKYKKWKDLEVKKDDSYRMEDAKELDEMILKKGEDSLLAVIYIDGNNMGAQVKELLEGDKSPSGKSYKTCVSKLRENSLQIQENYVDGPKAEIIKALKTRKDLKERRFIVAAGDEINFICNAHVAYELVETYVNSLPPGCSVCAGIAVFQSHMPYSDAYRIAEECCESGKKFMKDHKITNASFVDFHYCQGATGNSLEQIREDSTGVVISKPWMMRSSEPDAIDDIITEVKSSTSKESDTRYLVQKSDVKTMKEFLNSLGHSNVKALLGAALKGEKEYEAELARIRAHAKKDDVEIYFEGKYDTIDIPCGSNCDPKDIKRYLVYDMISVYDLWFK